MDLTIKVTQSPAAAALATAAACAAGFLCVWLYSRKLSVSPASSADANIMDHSVEEEYKMVILVRTDINMGRGKAAAQCCHAVLTAYKSAQRKYPKVVAGWESDGQPKVTLKVESESELETLLGKARAAGVVAEGIRDAGRTQLSPGTKTVGAIGPAPAKMINMITGHLKLY